jgi:hypothetical protein
MRQQVTRAMMEAALRELEIRIGVEPRTFRLTKERGRGGWSVSPINGSRQEARHLLAMLKFANKALEIRAWAERNGVEAS